MSDIKSAAAFAKTAAAKVAPAQPAAAPAAQPQKFAAEMTPVNDLQLAKLAAVELYEEAMQNLDFAQRLYKEASAVEKMAADSGAGVDVPITDQNVTPAASGILAGAPGGAALGADWGNQAGALNAFIEAAKQRRAQEQAAISGKPMQA